MILPIASGDFHAGIEAVPGWSSRGELSTEVGNDRIKSNRHPVD